MQVEKISSYGHEIHWIKDASTAEEQLLQSLHPDEQKLAATYKALNRKHEFIAGRWLFHQVTGSTEPLLRGPGGEPQWPAGICGALTHKQGQVMFSYVPAAGHLGYGIDLELTAKMKIEFREKVCSEQEWQNIRGSADAPVALLTAVFSFKECIYKALYPLEQKFFSFLDAEITNVDWAKGQISARLLSDVSAQTPSGFEVSGNFEQINSAILTCLLVNDRSAKA